MLIWNVDCISKRHLHPSSVVTPPLLTDCILLLCKSMQPHVMLTHFRDPIGIISMTQQAETKHIKQHIAYRGPCSHLTR
jgi:hypothetical protein